MGIKRIHAFVEKTITTTTTTTYTQSTVGELNSTWVECYNLVHVLHRLRRSQKKLVVYSWLCAGEEPNCVGIAMKDSGVAFFYSQQPNSTSLEDRGTLRKTVCGLTEDWLAYAKLNATLT